MDMFCLGSFFMYLSFKRTNFVAKSIGGGFRGKAEEGEDI